MEKRFSIIDPRITYLAMKQFAFGKENLEATRKAIDEVMKPRNIIEDIIIDEVDIEQHQQNSDIVEHQK